MHTIILFLTCALTLLYPHTATAASGSKGTASQILFQIRRGHIEDAIDLYRQRVELNGRADHELLQQIGLALLDYGSTSQDPETQLLATFGAGIALNERATHILARGLESSHPQIAVASLSLLAERQTDSADQLIQRAINSPNLGMRLEAIYQLAKKKHPAAVGQSEALMAKLPPMTWFLFAEIFATIGDARSIRQLRRLMNHELGEVRLSAILAAADHGRDDLLPQIRQLATHLDTNQQEACAGALGLFRDQNAIDRLKALADGKSANVRLAAAIALVKLGCIEYGQRIFNMAKEGNTLALFALGDVEGYEDFLAAQIGSPHTNIDLNATLALLVRRDVRCVPGIKRILLGDNRHLAFVKVVSQGKTLVGWKAVSSTSLADTPVALELSTAMRESCLRAATNLPESAFLSLAEAVLSEQQNDLVPVAVQMLENLGNDDAIALLKKYQQKVGAPLVRNSCNLALFRLDIEGPYAEGLRTWVKEQADVELIRFRPLVPRELSESGALHQLTPEETSRLFLTSIEALASRQDDHGVNVLLNLIRDGNPKNRYALAGVLIRTIQ